jgi:hypothetical protein
MSKKQMETFSTQKISSDPILQQRAKEKVQLPNLSHVERCKKGKVKKCVKKMAFSICKQKVQQTGGGGHK